MVPDSDNKFVWDRLRDVLNNATHERIFQFDGNEAQYITVKRNFARHLTLPNVRQPNFETNNQ